MPAWMLYKSSLKGLSLSSRCALLCKVCIARPFVGCCISFPFSGTIQLAGLLEDKAVQQSSVSEGGNCMTRCQPFSCLPDKAWSVGLEWHSNAGMPDLERALGRLRSAAAAPPPGLPSDHLKHAQNRLNPATALEMSVTFPPSIMSASRDLSSFTT